MRHPYQRPREGDSGEAAGGRYAATIQGQKSGDNATISRSASAIARSIEKKCHCLNPW